MFDLQLIAKMKEHALEVYPHEACGLVVNGEYVRGTNISTMPEEGFLMSDEAYMEAVKNGLQAVVHSHPDGPAHPSKMDMEQQMATAVPWGIIVTDGQTASDLFWFGDQVPTPELVGREFRHGVTDCYALIRDWYKVEKGVTLPEFPRAYDWWVADVEQDMYRKNFEEAGFEILSDPSKVQVGDVFVAQVRSEVPNHGGVYLGDGLILHHLVTRLSCRQPLIIWNKTVVMWLRYKGG